ncbi:uncharacterized protein NPIL_272711 [Nephila pilipes]|uniref:Uncharacterized protein n=1 Tax=Nephila pilipes TaxID=299642 RepID=A0A8X6UKU6_NEPPI|nr:uncharacterized protein NPIL_272711 [Nephila pilipes]
MGYSSTTSSKCNQWKPPFLRRGVPQGQGASPGVVPPVARHPMGPLSSSSRSPTERKQHSVNIWVDGILQPDKESLEGRMKNNRWRQQKSQPINWKPYYCVLLQDDRSFTHFPTEEMSIGERLFLELPRVRLDGGRQAFRRRWGYDMGVPSVPEEDEDSSELSETTSLRDERLLRFSSMEVVWESLKDVLPVGQDYGSNR